MNLMNLVANFVDIDKMSTYRGWLTGLAQAVEIR